MFYEAALNVFPTEIWEMIVFYLFVHDYQENQVLLSSQRVCQSIGLPFQPLISLYMKRLLPQIRQKALGILQEDYSQGVPAECRAIHMKPFGPPQYCLFYSDLGHFLKEIQYRLPDGWIDGIMDEFMKKCPKGNWQEIHLAYSRLEIMEFELEEQMAHYDSIQEWIHFLYIFLEENIFPRNAFLRVNYESFHSVLNSPSNQRRNRRLRLDEDDLWDLNLF